MNLERGRQSDIGATIGEAIADWEERSFVGRSFELQYALRMLERLADRPERILSVYGTAGMGKSFLLRQLGRLAERAGIRYIRVDMRSAYGRPDSFVGALLTGLGSSANAPGDEQAAAAERCVELLNACAADTRLMLAIDHYEEAGGCDQWLRDWFLPRLNRELVIVIAGRFALRGPWQLSPAWRRMIVPLPLAELSYDEVKHYMELHGFADEQADEQAWDQAWLRSLGHPLMLSMAAEHMGLSAAESGPARSPAHGGGPLAGELLRVWLDEAEDGELQDLILAASLPRTFHQELLETLMGRRLPHELFDRLTRLSFVCQAPGGWQLHDMVRESAQDAYRERLPEQFRRTAEQMLAYFEERVRAWVREPRNIAWEITEWLGHAGTPIIRAHFRHARATANYVETLDMSHRAELEAYLEMRERSACDVSIRCSDPRSQARFRYEMTAEDGLLQLRAADVPGCLMHVPGSVRAVRTPEGRIAALFAIVPIHEGTLDYLRGHSLSGPYFSAMLTAELEAWRTPADRPSGWFLLARDAARLDDDALRSDLLAMLFAYIGVGNRVIASPPPLDYYRDAHGSLGFDAVRTPRHGAYGGGRDARYYEVDTRGERMLAYIRRQTEPDGMRGAERDQAGSAAERQGPGEAMLVLTPREREVAELLMQGKSNAEIASSLYVSVAAVKKHMHAMMAKSGLRNRTELAGYFLRK